MAAWPAVILEETRAEELTRGCPASADEDACLSSHKLGIAYAIQYGREQAHLPRQIPRTAKAQREEVFSTTYRFKLGRPEAEQRTAIAVIDYDAVNSFNAPLRRSKTCFFGSINSAPLFKPDDIYDPDIDTIGW